MHPLNIPALRWFLLTILTAMPGCDAFPWPQPACADGQVQTFWRDQDSDTYGTSSSVVFQCAMPGQDVDLTTVPGYVWRQNALNEEDCDDFDPAIFPGAVELPCDGVRSDCQAKELDTQYTWYIDHDGDTFGSHDSRYIAATCDQTAPDGYVDNSQAEDCDDLSALTFPGATEIADRRDNNCDGNVDNNIDINDDDGDSFTESQGDCDDNDPLTFPGVAAREISSFLCMKDRDEDGFGDNDVAGAILTGSDCDDGDPAIFPNAPENCDRRDENCDNQETNVLFVCLSTADGGASTTALHVSRYQGSDQSSSDDPTLDDDVYFRFYGPYIMTFCDEATIPDRCQVPEDCATSGVRIVFGVDSNCVDAEYSYEQDQHGEWSWRNVDLSFGCWPDSSGTYVMHTYYDDPDVDIISASISVEVIDVSDPVECYDENGSKRVEIQDNCIDDDCDGNVDDINFPTCLDAPTPSADDPNACTP